MDTPAQVLAAAAQLAASVQVPKHGLDAVGVRELLAGFELELGDERAKAAEQRVRADLAEGRESELRDYSSKMQSQAIWLPVTIGGLSLCVGIGVGVLIEKVR